MILESEKSKFLAILTKINHSNNSGGKIFTQSELAEHLKVSRKKMNDFVNGTIFDFFLLCRYADLLGMEIKFQLNSD